MDDNDKIAAALEAYVLRGELAGAVTLIWRDGAVAGSAAVGWRDIEAGRPMTRDTIFRIASMTKPITSLAAMLLLEDGAFALDDPIAGVASEFAHMRVLRAPDGPLHESVAAARPITFEDLLTHRAGLTYGDFHTGPLRAAYADATGGDIDSPLEPDDWIARLAGLPLVDQPGAGFHYGCSTDLLGFLIARIAGEPLGALLQRRIFAPLGMADTGFIIPPEKHQRRAVMYGFDRDGVLAARAADPSDAFLAERPSDMAYVSGGAGLWSTVDDYLAFARVFTDGGVGNGAPLVKPQTLALMTANRLTQAQRAAARILGMPVFGQGSGFGLGVATVLDPATAARMRGRGGVGTVGWPGAYGGWWQADPTDGSVLIFLTHNLVQLNQMDRGLGLGALLALNDFQDLAGVEP